MENDMLKAENHSKEEQLENWKNNFESQIRDASPLRKISQKTEEILGLRNENIKLKEEFEIQKSAKNNLEQQLIREKQKNNADTFDDEKLYLREELNKKEEIEEYLVQEIETLKKDKLLLAGEIKIKQENEKKIIEYESQIEKLNFDLNLEKKINSENSNKFQHSPLRRLSQKNEELIKIQNDHYKLQHEMSEKNFNYDLLENKQNSVGQRLNELESINKGN